MTIASYERALKDQPTLNLLVSQPAQFLAYTMLACGNILVLSSMWTLGITGTYLGDYFGILMDHRVTAFPFNVTDAPMYYGSTLSFLGSAILYGKPAGIVLTLEVLAVYLVALRFEECVLPRRLMHLTLTGQSVHVEDIRGKGETANKEEGAVKNDERGGFVASHCAYVEKSSRGINSC